MGIFSVNDIVRFYFNGVEGVVSRVYTEGKEVYYSVFVQSSMSYVAALEHQIKKIGEYDPNA